RFGDVGPNGTITAREFVFGNVPETSGTVTVGTSSGGTGLSADHLEISGTSLHDVTASYSSLPSRHAVDLSVSFDPDGKSALHARLNIADTDDFTGDVTFSRVMPSTIRNLADAFGYGFPLSSHFVGTSLSGDATVDYRDGDIVATVPYVILEDPEAPDRIATLRGNYRNGTIQLDSFFLRYDEVFVDGDGLVHLGSGGTIDFETSFRVNRVPYDLRGLYTPGVSLTVFGPHDFRVRITRSSRGGIVIAGGASDIPLPIGDSRVDVSVDGLFLNQTEWFLTVDNLAVTSLPMPGGGTGDARLAIAIAPETTEIVLLEFRDPVGVLAGRFDVQYASVPEREIRITGRVGSIDGSEQYRIAGRYVEGSFAADLRFEEAPLRRLHNEVSSGTLTGAVQLVGDGTSPQLRAYLESDTIRVGGQQLRFQGRVYGDDRSIRADDVEVVAASRSLEVSELTVDRRDGTIVGHARFERPQGQGTIDAFLDGRTDPIPSLELPSLRALPVALSVYTEYQRPSAITGQQEITEYTYSIVKGARRTEIRRADNAIRGYVLDTGEFEVELTEPLPASAVATGVIRDGEVELTASGIAVDLAELVGNLPENVPVSVSRGTLEGSLRVLGPIGDPDVYGTLRIIGLEATSMASPDMIGPLDAALILEENAIRLTRFETAVGDASLRGGGTILLNRLALAEYQLNLEIPDEQGIHIDTVAGPIDVDGYFRGGIRITGRPRDISLAGNVVVSGAEIGVVPGMEPTTNAETMNVAADLTLETGRGVRFIWPAADFPVIRSNFEVGQEIAIRFDGADETFSLIGDLGIQSGDIFYFDRNFLIREGEIVFQENQDRFDPRVSARAELREVTPDGPVRIYLVADGQRLSEFSPRFESNPPLGGTDIVAILGGNIFQQGTEDSTNLSTALLSTSDIVTQFGVFREFENNVRARLDLDLFAIRTSVIQNLLLTAITPTDETTEQLAPTLGNYLNNTSIFMGRYLGDSVFGQAILQMRSADMEDPANDDGIQRLGGVLIDSEISLEWQTPFFMLEWSLAPENPEELFIRDNTFTFSWSFSY
ncbi:MAG: translocation/assembly module TamB domain-containing protein, partial [Alkalispirochaeta sp.]